jgi:acetyltransferase-like isoleucine patch superfamily enzyme
MSYYSYEDLKKLKFKSLGKNVLISDKASFYNCELIEIGDYSRIDDFCVISGKICIGKFVHVTPTCLLAGGHPGIFIDDFCTLAYGVKIFSQSDDYSGESLTNSLIPKKYKTEKFESVKLGKHVILGTNSVVHPGVIIGEGCSSGSMTLINNNLEPWGIYAGIPAKRIKERSRKLLELEKKFIEEIEKNDSF